MLISGLFSDYLILTLGKPRIKLNNLKTSLRLHCLGLNLIIDSINPLSNISVTEYTVRQRNYAECLFRCHCQRGQIFSLLFLFWKSFVM